MHMHGFLQIFTYGMASYIILLMNGHYFCICLCCVTQFNSRYYACVNIIANWNINSPELKPVNHFTQILPTWKTNWKNFKNFFKENFWKTQKTIKIQCKEYYLSYPFENIPPANLAQNAHDTGAGGAFCRSDPQTADHSPDAGPNFGPRRNTDETSPVNSPLVVPFPFPASDWRPFAVSDWRPFVVSNRRPSAVSDSRSIAEIIENFFSNLGSKHKFSSPTWLDPAMNARLLICASCA